MEKILVILLCNAWCLGVWQLTYGLHPLYNNIAVRKADKGHISKISEEMLSAVMRK